MPILIPEGVTIELDGQTVVVKGPKGELSLRHVPQVSVKVNDGQVVVERSRDADAALHGLTRALIFAMVEGVTKGFAKELEMAGIGYRASLEGKDLILNVGYSHPVKIEAPEGISFSVSEGRITVSGFDKGLVGQIAADIRAVRPPEPYKGKGIHYIGEYIRRKPGKTAKATTGGTGGK
jgi:large subunit ribosomal protein L6